MEVDLKARGAIGSLVDEDGVHRRPGLEPRRGVDDIAVGGRLALVRTRVHVHHRLSGGDPDPDLQGGYVLSRCEAVHGLAHGVGGPHGALGIVLMGHRRAEERHHGVADELLDGTAVALELLARPPVVRVEHPANVLGVEPLRHAREADDVDEDDAHDLALQGDRRAGELGAARGAEGHAGRQRPGAAGGAGRPEHSTAAPAENRVSRVEEAARWAAGTHRAPCRRGDTTTLPTPFYAGRGRGGSRMRSATSAVQPVWCIAPSPAPLSPLKYSKNRRLSFQTGSSWRRAMPPKTGRSVGPGARSTRSGRRDPARPSRTSAAGRTRSGTRP